MLCTRVENGSQIGIGNIDILVCDYCEGKITIIMIIDLTVS